MPLVCSWVDTLCPHSGAAALQQRKTVVLKSCALSFGKGKPQFSVDHRPMLRKIVPIVSCFSETYFPAKSI